MEDARKELDDMISTAVLEEEIKEPPKKRGRPPKKEVPHVEVPNFTAPKQRIAPKEKAPPNVKFGTVDPSPKIKIDKIHKLSKYYEYFPQLERSIDLLRLTDKELTEELERCQKGLASEEALLTLKKLDVLSMWVTEKTLTQLGYPVHGLTLEAQATQHLVESELKELSIKYASWLESGPEFRYIMKCVGRITTVIAQQTRGPMQHSPQYDRVNPGVVETDKYKDL